MGDGLNADGLGFRENVFGNVGSSENPSEVNEVKTASPSDDFSGIQSALDSFTSSEWSKLELIPGGEYSVDTVERLEVPSKTIIDGKGAQLTGNGDETTDSHLLLTNDDWPGGNSNIVIKNMDIDGAFTDGVGAKTDSFGGLVQFTNVSDVTAENLFIDQAYRHCFQFVKTTDSTVRDCRFERARGDDPFSISDGGEELGGTLGASESRRVLVDNCIADNYEPPQTGFETDDGPKFVYYHNCKSIPMDTTGFSVKTHPSDAPPTDIYHDHCYSGENIFVRTNTASTDEVTGDVKNIHFNNCHIGGSAIVRTRDTFFRGGRIENSMILEDDPSDACTITVDGVEFTDTVGAAQFCIEMRAVDRATVRDCDFVDVGNSRSVYVHPDNETAQNITIESNYSEHSAQEKSGIELNPENGATISDIDIRDNTLVNGNNGIRVQGTSANYSGQCQILQNKMRDSNFNAIWFSDDTTPRQIIITLGNRGENFSAGQDPNASPQEPTSPQTGDEYLDDGTNTGDSNPHRRYYDGTAWNDL